MKTQKLTERIITFFAVGFIASVFYIIVWGTLKAFHVI